jgi:hypothetical protein
MLAAIFLPKFAVASDMGSRVFCKRCSIKPRPLRWDIDFNQTVVPASKPIFSFQNIGLRGLCPTLVMTADGYRQPGSGRISRSKSPGGIRCRKSEKLT